MLMIDPLSELFLKSMHFGTISSKNDETHWIDSPYNFVIFQARSIRDAYISKTARQMDQYWSVRGECGTDGKLRFLRLDRR